MEGLFYLEFRQIGLFHLAKQRLGKDNVVSVSTSGAGVMEYTKNYLSCIYRTEGSVIRTATGYSFTINKLKVEIGR